MTSNAEFLAFIRDTVRSVWALELLLLLRRSAPKAWAAQALVDEMRASPGLVDANLQVFEARGLVRREADDCWTYAPLSPVLAALCDRLAATYKDAPVRLINTIASPTDDRLRTLADAFRFKGDDK
ncbi:MAG: hypothetical protein JSR45_17375 [Proteobacteria bacterium]|nr:hypothetical protein [Pseudomonadota bacterium]